MTLGSKGIFRLWAVLSIFWVGYVAWNSDLACPLQLMGLDTGAGPWCAYQNAEPVKYYTGLIGRMATPPIICAVLLFAIWWVYSGFRETSGKV